MELENTLPVFGPEVVEVVVPVLPVVLQQMHLLEELELVVLD